jgi:hypothetical protein
MPRPHTPSFELAPTKAADVYEAKTLHEQVRKPAETGLAQKAANSA